jgi:hypothetical protein
MLSMELTLVCFEANMRAMRIHKYGDSSTLQLEETPALSIQSDEILVRVRDAGSTQLIGRYEPAIWKV